MKKLSISLLVMLLIASLFTSCSMGSDDASDVRVKVRLTPSGGGRSLTTDIEKINLDDDSITWHYSATKVTEKQFNYGATSDSILPKDGIVTLSQGDWSIGLWGIKDGKTVYTGTTNNVTIKWNFYEPNVTVPVPVTQNTGDYGYIVLTDVKIPVNEELKTPNYASIDTTIITNLNGANMRIECAPGSHTITFEYRNSTGSTISSKSLVVTVISGRETTISGNIEKGEITSGGSSAPTSEVQVIEVKKEVEVKVETSVSPATTSTPGTNTTVTFPAGSFNDNSSNAVLNLSVKSAGSEFSVTSSSSSAPVAGIDISLKVDDQEITSFNGKEVEITTYILAGLENVQVKYTGEGDHPTLVSYNSVTGELVFKTNHFSEYYVLADCEAVNTIKNVGYKSFVDALANASEGDTILLKKDITLVKNDSTPYGTVKITKGININLNGYDITGDNFRTLQFVEGISTISGKGTISSTVDNVGSSVIRVGDNNAKSDVSLSIGKDVTISTSTAYGITVFGSKSETLEVYGKIRSSAPSNDSYDGCAIATVGTDSTTATITINKGADVSAENTNAIYMPSGVLNVKGGSISGMTGIYIKSANATISGGTITGIGDKKEYSYYGNGGISTGDALVVDSCGYPNGNPSVRVTGGVFISEKAKSVGSYKYNNNPLITGFIEGGIFSDNPSLCLAKYYGAIKKDNKYIVAKLTESNGVISIKEAEELILFANIVNECGYSFYGKTVKLTDDINLAGIEWIPIGTNADGINKFKGTFDGQGHTISNMTINQDKAYHAAGFFGALNGTAKNIIFDNASVSSISSPNSEGNTDNGTAIVAGSIYTSGSIESVTVKNSTVSGNRYVGGISGYTYGSVKNCTVENTTITSTPDDLTGKYDNGDKAGGVVGAFWCENTYEISGNTVSDVTVTGYRDIGGIVGFANGKVTSNTVNGLTLIQDYSKIETPKQTVEAIIGRHNGFDVDTSNEATDVIIKVTVKTLGQFDSAIDYNSSIITINDNIELTEAISISVDDITITGDGSSTISGYPIWISSTKDKPVSIKFDKVNFATPDIDNDQDKASCVYASSLYGKVEFTNCKFTNPQWECIQITPMDGAEIVVTDCTFEADGTGTYAHGTLVERLLHIQNTNATGKYTAVITNNNFIGVDLCRNAVIDVDDIEAFANVTCGGNTFANHDGTPVSTLEDGMIYININGKYTSKYVATNTYAQFIQTPAAPLKH